ncbi:uncharacterized protein EI90DRAFT_2930641, partial [Cantharellus anzutake]|uniref:uncharacterized protein n=1 Tax=Cantharellus anzutake TaxID=1750568 RepID=UPI0019063572
VSEEREARMAQWRPSVSTSMAARITVAARNVACKDAVSCSKVKTGRKFCRLTLLWGQLRVPQKVGFCGIWPPTYTTYPLTLPMFILTLSNTPQTHSLFFPIFPIIPDNPKQNSHAQPRRQFHPLSTSQEPLHQLGRIRARWKAGDEEVADGRIGGRCDEALRS